MQFVLLENLVSGDFDPAQDDIGGVFILHFLSVCSDAAHLQ
jgi:hypothetical protein